MINLILDKLSTIQTQILKFFMVLIRRRGEIFFPLTKNLTSYSIIFIKLRFIEMRDKDFD